MWQKETGQYLTNFDARLRLSLRCRDNETIPPYDAQLSDELKFNSPTTLT